MTSLNQIAANQANAARSTGPRTDAGKARSAQNARKHGLTARHLVIRPDEQEEFNDLQADLTAELDPQGPLEQLTFNNLLLAAWNMQRCRRAETELAAQGPDPLLDEESGKKQDRISRYFARHERSYYKALKQLQQFQTLPVGCPAAVRGGKANASRADCSAF